MNIIETINKIKNEMDAEIVFKNDHTYGLKNLVHAYLVYNNEYKLDINAMDNIAVNHDNGKDNFIIRYFTSRPRRLKRFEKKFVDMHAVLGALLSANKNLTPFELRIIANHHKWFNTLENSDFSQEEIDAISIIVIFDCLEAMLFKRSYKPGWGIENVLAIMDNEVGHFNPVIYEDVKKFIASVPDIKEIARPSKKEEITNTAVTI